MSSNKNYNDSNVHPFHDKTSHPSSSGNSTGNQSSAPQRGSGVGHLYGSKYRSRVTSSPGGKLTVPRPVNLPSKRKETQQTDSNGPHFANSSASVGWARTEEHPSSSQNPDHASWMQSGFPNRLNSWNGPSHTQVFENTNQFGQSLHLNQEEYPTLEAAMHPKLPSSTTGGLIRREQTPDRSESTYYQTTQVDNYRPRTDEDRNGPRTVPQFQRSNWHDDERRLPTAPNEQGNLHPNPAVSHGAYYAPVQMYPGRAVVQPPTYYGYVPYSDGLYHQIPQQYYPQMYAPYPPGYLQGDQVYQEQDLFPRVNHHAGLGDPSSGGRDQDNGRDAEKEAFELEQRTRAMKLAESLKQEDPEHQSSSERWNGDGAIRLIRRPNRTESQQQNSQTTSKAPDAPTVPERQESLMSALLQRQDGASMELDWDAQVDAEEKKKEEAESTKLETPSPVEVRQESQTTEWDSTKYSINHPSEDTPRSPVFSTRRFVDSAPQGGRHVDESGGFEAGRRVNRGRYRPRGPGPQNWNPREEFDRFTNSTPEKRTPTPVRMFPGRGFRPKDSPGRSPHHPDSSSLRFGDMDPDFVLGRPQDSSMQVRSPRAGGRLIRGRGGRGRHPRGRHPEYVRQAPRYSHSPGVSEGGGYYRGGSLRGVRVPRGEGGYRGSSSPFRGRGRRRDSPTFNPRGRRMNATTSPKMRWVPKQPPSGHRD